MHNVLKSILSSANTWISNLLALNPPTDWPKMMMWGYVAFIGLCLVIALGGYFLPIRSSLKSRILTFAWTNVLIGPALFFFRYEGVPLLGMDIWRLLQELSAVAWIVTIIRFSRVGMKKEIIAEQVVAYKEKFLPKPKSR